MMYFDANRAGAAGGEGGPSLEELFDRVSEAVVVVGRDWRFTYVNARAAELNQRTRDELVGSPVTALVPGLSVEPYRARLHQAMQDGVPIRFELRTDAPERWLEVRAFPAPEGLSVFLEDISARRRAEAALAETGLGAAMDALLADAPVGFALLDLDLRYVRVNRALARFHGRPAEEHPGRTPGELFGEQPAAALRPLLERARAGEATHRAELRLRDHDLHLSCYPVRLQGEVAGVGVTAEEVTALKHAEAALRENERQLRLITDNVPALIGYVDRMERYRFNNHEYEVWFGMPAESLYGRPVVEVVGEAAYALIEPYVRAALAGHRASYELEMPYKSSMPRYVSAEYVPDVADGEVRGYVALVQDVSARRLAEERQRFLLELHETIRPLRDPKAILRAAQRLAGARFGASRAACGEVDAGQAHVAFDRGYTDGVAGIAGTHRLEDFGDGFVRELKAGRPVVVEDVRQDPRVNAELFDRIETQALMCVPLVREERLTALFVLHDREPRAWTREEAALLEEVAERTWAALGSARAEAALRASERRFSAAFRINPNPMSITTLREGRFLDVNESFVQMFGLAREEVIGRTSTEVGIWANPSDRAELFRRVAEQNAARNMEIVFRTAKGEERVLLLSSESVELDGRTCLINAATDISERKRVEEQLAHWAAEIARTNEELRRSNRELEQFAYVASHDLQEPLRMISNYVRLLARRYRGRLDAEADEMIGFAEDGARRMKALIDDLLALSRVGTRGGPFEPIEMRPLVEQVLASLRFAVEERGAEVVVEELPTVHGDSWQLAQVFQNLIVNAIKFSDAGRRCLVRVSAGRVEGGWRFSVSDNGIGIEPRYFDRIFQVFQRLHTHQEYEGTGIGLAICKKIVERHGGRIWVESEPGRGTTFHFTLAG